MTAAVPDLLRVNCSAPCDLVLQVDGVRNPLVQGVYLQDCPIQHAAWAAGGAQVRGEDKGGQGQAGGGQGGVGRSREWEMKAGGAGRDTKGRGWAEGE